MSILKLTLQQLSYRSQTPEANQSTLPQIQLEHFPEMSSQSLSVTCEPEPQLSFIFTDHRNGRLSMRPASAVVANNNMATLSPSRRAPPRSPAPRAYGILAAPGGHPTLSWPRP